ncbi:TPA: GHKL domain-containing protein [Streptococcus pyogenes]|uniref:sensor histidine kinase n=1 Tax=Streptococcus pyogenes TaxID=1314 RepID=UPI0010A191DE|nr:GHKL domain-containing protein [Streptococcus pyogenes]VGQ36585.1 truncated SilB [Streptococcus pyogenes]VGQ71676.1 truncated SilB [Streptococcus pyogenes]VGU92380.1 truncated SilB [Streptococcus pyogenes]HEP1412765.1 GHKL domain-containing protein [Streptococcus pyogenes]
MLSLLRAILGFIYVIQEIVIATKISGEKISVKKVSLALLFFIGVAAVLATLVQFLDQTASELLYSFRYLAVFLLYSYFVLRIKNLKLLIFYSVFPLLLCEILQDFFLYFVFPRSPLEAWTAIDNILGRTIIGLLANVFAGFYLIFLGYDFSYLRKEHLDLKDKHFFNVFNGLGIFFYSLPLVLMWLESAYQIDTSTERRFLNTIFTLALIAMTNTLDRHLRTKLQQNIVRQKDFQLKNIKDYSFQVEGLYQDVRSFRHDYANILTSLRLGIESRNIDEIASVYDEVLKDSGRQLRHQKFEIGKLHHMQDTALKSLLASKFAKARDKSVPVLLELPNDIRIRGMDKVDFLTIISILIDNAIGAAAEAGLTVSYFDRGIKQVFIIQNATKEKTIDISRIFKRGFSSKGGDRGGGLSNVREILGNYPTALLRTKSDDYLFTQILEIEELFFLYLDNML